MFCPKCGSTIEEGGNVCQNCGLDITTVDQSPTTETTLSALTPTGDVPVAVPESDKKTEKSVIRFVYFGLAAVVLVMFFIAAGNIASGGNEIMQIKSVGGKTLEEAYYYELGSIYTGYAIISRALGIFFASVLVWLGLKTK